MNKVKLYIFIVLNIICKCLTIFIPFGIQKMIDSVLSNDPVANLNYWGSILIIVYLISTIVQSSYSFLLEMAERKLIISLQDKIRNDIRNSDYHKIKEKTIGYYFQRFTQDCEQSIYLYYEKKILLFSNIVFLFLLLAVMISYSLYLTLILLGLILFFIVFTKVILPMISKYEHHSIIKKEDVNSFFENSMNGYETIRNYQAYTYFDTKFKNLSKNFLDVLKKNIFVEVVYDIILVGLTMSFSNLLIYWMGGHSIIKGTMTIGSLTAFSIYFSRLNDVARVFMDMPKRTTKAKVAQKRIEEIEQLIYSSNELDQLNEEFSVLTLSDVSFSFERCIFSHFSMQIKRGEIIGVVGKNGSGKSTLARIIVKSIKNEEGNILFNDHHYKTLSEKFIKSRFLLVGPDVFLFNGTVGENIAFSDQKRISGYGLNLLDKVNLNLNQLILENGTNLSSGQKRMIELARAFERPYDLIIFDEPLNYVDAENRKIVLNAIKALSKTSAILIISHDKEALDYCESIYCIDS